ncbi:helix-turn-helix domain-containing protein, partial [Nocardiopsis rhodophaea]|uniref:helix-turn-helix domain-containing protein n=1 Tax=Nocardiopsis rhodophaea TaxID=280238 RepID=UPI0039EED70D
MTDLRHGVDVTETQEPTGQADDDWMVEHRLRAVAEVLDGAPIADVARRYATSRQSLHTWLRRFREGGRDGLRDRSRRPRTSPSRVPVEVELAICQLRQTYPKWGARRIAHELEARGGRQSAGPLDGAPRPGPQRPGEPPSTGPPPRLQAVAARRP